MDHKQRHRRLHLLIGKLNKERRRQAQKIDILCNDFVSAHRDFIERLNIINFTANFYEAIVGTTDLRSLLYTAGKLIKEEIPESNVAFFVLGSSLHTNLALQKDGKMGIRKKSLNGAPLQRDSFKLYMFESDQPITLGGQYLSAPLVSQAQVRNCFTSELVDNICKLNKLCTLDDMFAMGLQGNLIELNRISAIAVPLHRFGSPPFSHTATV